MTATLERARGLVLVGERERARLDEHARLYARGDYARDRLHERAGIGQAGDDGRRFGRKVAGVRRDLDAGARKQPAALGIDIVTDHPPAGGDEILGKRAAHDAETDDADGTFIPCHSRLPILNDASP